MITTSIHKFVNIELLKKYIQTDIQPSSKLLIQVFFNNSDENYIKTIQQTLNHMLPDAHIIGTTTDGSIHNAQEDINATVISFTCFEKSDLRHKLFQLEANQEYKTARDICETLVCPNTKVIILFTEGLQFNIELLIKEIHTIAPNIILAGGLAGDNAQFTKTVVCDNIETSTQGIVAVSINSDSLFVHNDYNLSWESIGKSMFVTKCKNNVVYELDGVNPIQQYQNFLGSHTLKKYQHDFIPTVGIEFPFIIKRDDFPIARAALGRDGKSITFAGSFKEGDKLHFSFTNIEKIIESGVLLSKRLQYKPVETIFVYSCMARRRFMKENIVHDLKPLIKIAPVSGFYTYGEIYSTSNTKEFLNHTMTILALSEEDELFTHKVDNIQVKNDNLETLNMLTKLLKVSSKEAKEENILKIANDLFWNDIDKELVYQEKKIPLTKSETLLIDLLIQNINTSIDSYTIFTYIWKEKEFNQNSIRTLIKKIRKKLPTDIIQNSYGGFYRLDRLSSN